jgi:hydroxymethylbilane synthase
MAQAEEARARLCAAHGWSEDSVELVAVLSSGDKVQDRPLSEIGGKALWTRELDQWLGEGRIDAAVHSLKDVETLRPESLALAAILPRADKRDVLLGAASLAALPQGATIGTSAPRRAAQALHARPDCRVVTFRGNVATRMARLAAGEADATFLAAAGLARLGETGAGHPLDPAEVAAGAGAGRDRRSSAARTTRARASCSRRSTTPEPRRSHGRARAARRARRQLPQPGGGAVRLRRRNAGDARGAVQPDGAERVDGAATSGRRRQRPARWPPTCSPRHAGHRRAFRRPR